MDILCKVLQKFCVRNLAKMFPPLQTMSFTPLIRYVSSWQRPLLRSRAQLHGQGLRPEAPLQALIRGRSEVEERGKMEIIRKGGGFSWGRGQLAGRRRGGGSPACAEWGENLTLSVCNLGNSREIRRSYLVQKISEV